MLNWRLKVDEAAGVVDMASSDASMRFKATAIISTDFIRFELLDASFAIDRQNGAIKRTLIEHGVAHVAEGVCSPEVRSGLVAKIGNQNQQPAKSL